VTSIEIVNVVLAVGLILVVAQPRGLRAVALHPKTPGRIARGVVAVIRAMMVAVSLSAFAVFCLFVLSGAVEQAAR